MGKFLELNPAFVNKTEGAIPFNGPNASTLPKRPMSYHLGQLSISFIGTQFQDNLQTTDYSDVPVDLRCINLADCIDFVHKISATELGHIIKSAIQICIDLMHPFPSSELRKYVHYQMVRKFLGVTVLIQNKLKIYTQPPL